MEHSSTTAARPAWYSAAASAGLVLLIVNLVAAQSFVEACPYVLPAPLACDPTARASILAFGLCSAAGLLLAFGLLMAFPRRPSRVAPALHAFGAVSGAGASAACAIALAVSQRL